MNVYVTERSPAELLGPEFERCAVAIIHSIPPDNAVLVLVDPDRALLRGAY